MLYYLSFICITPFFKSPPKTYFCITQKLYCLRNICIFNIFEVVCKKNWATKIQHKGIRWKIKENKVQNLTVLILDCCGDKWKTYFLVHEERSLSSILCQGKYSNLLVKRFPLFLFSQVNEIEHHTSNTFDVYMSKSFIQIQWRHIWMLRHSTFYVFIEPCFDKDMLYDSLSAYIFFLQLKFLAFILV